MHAHPTPPRIALLTMGALGAIGALLVMARRGARRQAERAAGEHLREAYDLGHRAGERSANR